MNERSETSSYCDSIEKSVREAKAVLGKCTKDEMDFLYKRVGKLIEYVTSRIDYYENARSRIFTASATLLGFGVTVLAFGINYLADAPWLRWSVIILIGAAILAMSMHLYHSLRSYSFEEAVQSPWFYIGNVQNLEKLKWNARKKEDAKKAICKDVAQNINQMAKENLAGALEKDIAQLVKLYAILASKDENVDSTANVLEWGLVVFILSLIILYVVNLVVPLP